MSISITDAVLAIKADAKIVVRGDDVDGIEWIDGETPISKSDILAKQTELQTAYDAKAYARARAVAYPSVDDFMEAYTEKEIGSASTKWDAYVIAYNKVRTDNPKP